MKKVALILVGCLLFTQLQAQVIYNSTGRKGETRYQENATKKGFNPHRLIFGGGMSFGFANGSLLLSVSPIVGYRLSNRFAMGLRAGYQYNWVKDGMLYINGITGAVEGKNLNYHIFSPGAWARLIVWNNIFLNAEYQYNIFTYKKYEMAMTQPGYTSERSWDHANTLLLGIGLRQPVSYNASFVLIVSYDVLQNIPSNMRIDASGNKYSVSPYANTLDVRIGFNIGF